MSVHCPRCQSTLVFPIDNYELDCLECGEIITTPRILALDRLADAVVDQEIRDALPFRTRKTIRR